MPSCSSSLSLSRPALVFWPCGLGMRKKMPSHRIPIPGRLGPRHGGSTGPWTLTLDPTRSADYPVGIDWPLYEDITCQVPEYSGFNHTCTLGGMPSYVVDVANVAQVQIAVNFARNRNLRLVVKNSGHDFNSKSTGAGALSVWLKHLDQIDLVEDYDGGMAVRMGAGVDAIDLYEFCDVHDCRAVSGVVTTVGTAGGYSQGGGHSPLLGVKGLGSDQILSISVVLPDGSFVECNEQQNQDLFWAIRGGGGATFGIVTSMVFRVYPNAPIATVTYSFQNPTGSQLSVFWSGLEVFWASFPQFADAGQYRYFIVAVDPTTDTGIVNMTVHWGNDMTREELEAMNQPFFKNLTNVGIQINDINYQAFDSYLTAFNTSFPPYTADSMGTWVAHTASRLWPRGNWEDPAKFAVQNEVLKKHLEAGYILIAYNFMVAKNPEVNQDNSANPAWRDTLMHCMTPAIWTMSATPELVASASQNLTMSLNPWRAASPGSGAYMNEADINEPDFEQSFYGSYYPRLYQLKQQYDPWGLLYAITAVGSENWYITGQIPWYPTQNGRLCPVGP